MWIANFSRDLQCRYGLNLRSVFASGLQRHSLGFFIGGQQRRQFYSTPWYGAIEPTKALAISALGLGQ